MYELGQVALQPGLPPGAEDWDNQDILRFFSEELRVPVCILHHGWLGGGRMWSELDEGILRMVLLHQILSNQGTQPTTGALLPGSNENSWNLR